MRGSYYNEIDPFAAEMLRDRFWRALHTISKYMPPRELETKSERVYGLPPSEATEYAYENVLNTARDSIKGTRKPT